MKRPPHKQKHEEDTDVDTELVPEVTEVAASSLEAKLKKLRADLRACQKEKDENLAGWQRAKADLVNFRRLAEADRSRDVVRAKSSVLQAILPVLDSFESAMEDKGWQKVDEEWREGVRRIAEQLTNALTHEGLVAFGCKGDAFDPTFHECMSVVPVEDAAKDHTIVEVLQKGYRLGDEVVRAAKVIVAQTEAP